MDNQTAWNDHRFGGIAGRVVREALGFGTFLTGIFLVGVASLLGVLTFKAGADALGLILVHILFAIMLGRFALQGYHGHWNTGALYPREAGWGASAVVAIRYLALSVAWTLPLIILGLRPDALRDNLAGVALMGGGGRLLTLGVLYVAAAVITPPILLIVSVSADRFTHIFSPSHWAYLFRGRWGDLFLVYALCLGGVTMTILLVAPVLAAISFQAPRPAIFLTAIAGAWASGFAISVYGRLCGCFAGALLGGDMMEPELRLIESPPADSGRGATERKTSVELDSSVGGPPTSSLSGRPPLLDARERIESILTGTARGSDEAITAIESLRDHHAPNPVIDYGLCVALFRSGQRERAAATAAEILPQLLDRGNRRFAAQIYGDLLDECKAFDLASDHLVLIATDFLERGESRLATEALMHAIRTDPWHRAAIKRMMQLAEEILPASREPHEARRIYRFLIEKCPDSPLAEMMHSGLREAERVIEKSDRRSA